MHLILFSQKCKGMHSFHSKTHGKKTKREKNHTGFEQSHSHKFSKWKKNVQLAFLQILSEKKTTHGNIVT